MMRIKLSGTLLALVVSRVAGAQSALASPDGHYEHATAISVGAFRSPAADTLLPAGVADAAARLAASPRHREWVMISAGGTDSVGAWVIYPQRSTRAPVVVVVHEIFGLSTWIKGVGDQLAAQGFIAIVPDLLTGVRMNASPDSLSVDSAMALIRTLKAEDVQRRLIGVAQYGMHLPAALPRYGIVGFCWGGGVAFAHAAMAPSVNASVVYYGPTPDSTVVAKVHAPILGLYGGNDARVDVGVPKADSILRHLGRTYEYSMFAGAGHGFLRDQAGLAGANLAATQQAWPKTIAWFQRYLEK